MIEVKDLELIVKEQSLGKLITNALDIKQFVEEKVKEYTPENYIGRADLAKEDRAVLNNAGKTLNDKRLQLEREFMKPFNEFKGLIDDAVKTIKGAATKLDGIVKEEEEREKSEKKSKIEEYFSGTGFTLLPLSRLFDQKWLNKTCKDKEWKDSIDNSIAKIKSDIQTLESFPEDADTLTAFYLDTLDISMALQKGNQLKANREILKKAKPVEPSAIIPEAEPVVITKQEDVPVEGIPMPKNPSIPVFDPIMITTLKITGRRSDLSELRKFMDANDLRYEKLS